jgi:molecular chaperone Hsp33
MMPDAPEEIISAIEEKLKVIEPLTTMLDKGMTQEDILNELVGDFDPHILDKIPVEYYCNCSKERVEKALISIGKDEIQDIIENEGSTSLHCHFCNKDYEFSKEELEALLKRI